MEILFPPNQATAFLNMSIVGFFLAFLYDLFKFKHMLFGVGFITLFIDDFLFWCFSAITFLFSVFILNNGIFRWYELLFCVIGFIFYRFTLSKLVIPLLKLLSRVIKQVLTFLFAPFMLLFKPFVRVFYYLKSKRLLNKHKNMIYRCISDLYPSGSEINE